MRIVLSILVVATTAVSSVAAGQTEKTADKPPAQTPADSYTYQAGGRRDPFLNLLGTGTEPRPVARKGDGLTSLTVAEIAVFGIMQSRDALVAMIAGPDKKTYVVHAGDRLLDGIIKDITAQGLVVTQRVTDALAQVTQREVRKLLKSLEDARQ